MQNDKKILVVDDSRGWLDFHESALKQIYGDEFIIDKANSARSGYDAVYNNLSNPYKLIISDLQMELDFEPEYAGEWFIGQVRKLAQCNRTKIIIISATYNIRIIARSLQVKCLPKAIAARDLTSYKLAMDELLKG